MKPLYSQEQFKLAKSMDILPCQCYHCSSTFYVLKKRITHELKDNKGKNKFCSPKCLHDSQKTKKLVQCTNCGCEFLKLPNQIKKFTNHYCSNACNASYCMRHKTFGSKRSKLEIYIEEQLTLLYPNIQIDFNKNNTIGSELDIYIPSLNIAFELNGIFHYEPIYGVNKLDQIQNNDISKSKTCHDKKIDLCIIDTSQQKNFKESTSQKYLHIIINIINERLLII